MRGRSRFARPSRRRSRKKPSRSKSSVVTRTVEVGIPVNKPLYEASRYWYQDVTYKIDRVNIDGKNPETFIDVSRVEVHADHLVVVTRKGKLRRKFVQVIPLDENARVSVTHSTKQESMWDYEHSE